jgi:hypothetical protein
MIGKSSDHIIKDTRTNYGRPNFAQGQANQRLSFSSVLESRNRYFATRLHPSLYPYLHGM